MLILYNNSEIAYMYSFKYSLYVIANPNPRMALHFETLLYIGNISII